MPEGGTRISTAAGPDAGRAVEEHEGGGPATAASPDEIPSSPRHGLSAARVWSGWAKATGGWLAGKQRLFLVLSLLIIVSDFLFIAINFESGKRALDEEWQEAWQRARATLDLAIEEQSNTMLMLASGYAADPEIQRLFLAGREALASEGGGRGGPATAVARQALYDRVAPGWQRITADFRVRQLHFHLGPGSLSFLRVHRPERFGDRMDDLRHIIVDTIAGGTPRTGFETGRVYSGLRGVTPLTAPGPGGERVVVGALEAGTSFETLMRLLDDALGAGVAVLLTEQHVSETMWDEFVGEHFTSLSGDCRCFIEARSRDEILGFIRDGMISTAASPTPVRVAELDGRTYSLLQFPLRDYLGEHQPGRDPVGQIVVWRDVSERMASFRQDQFTNVAFAVSALVIIELLLFFGVRFVTRARDAAQAGDRAKSNFLATMSHEFRTPLNAIIGFSDLMKSGMGGPLGDTQKEYMEHVFRAGKHLLHNIDRLLQYQKIESGERGVKTGPVDLAAEVRRLLEAGGAAADEAGVGFEASLPDSLVVQANRDAVEQAFSEILGNALAVSPAGTSVRIDLSGSGKQALLTVSDSGPGFPPDRLAALARPFTKTQGVFEQADGFGMGLAIVRALLVSQGGCLQIENMPGGGARIRMVFRKQGY